MRQTETDLLSEIREQLTFEILLGNISAYFVNLPADRIDDGIKESQRRICEYLDLDRSALWQLSGKEPGKALLTHVYQPPKALLPDEPLDAGASFPWALNKVLRKEIVAINRLADLPPEANCDRESFQRLGVRSGVVVPLSIGGRVLGALTFTRLQEEGDWPCRVVERFLHIAQVFANALVRKRGEKSMRDRLEFETMLTDISTRFVNLPADKIDGEIEDAQRRICECIGLEISALWQVLVEIPRNHVLTHIYRLLEDPPLPERMTADEYFPWCLEHVEAGEVIAVSTEELPVEAARDQEVWRHYGIKSSLVIPLSAGREPPSGVISFHTTKAKYTWTGLLVKQLNLVAQIFTNAIARKRAEVALQAARDERSQAEGIASAQHRRLVRFSKERALGAMATGIAHEINQPLIAIQNYAQAAKRRLHSDPAQTAKLDELLDKIEQQSGRAGDIIQRIRTLVTSDDPELRPVSLYALLDQVTLILGVDLERHGCRIDYRPRFDVPEVLADALQIQMVLVNLLQNAAQSMQSLEGKADKTIRIDIEPINDREVQVSVADRGRGVPPDRLGDIFEPFSSDKAGGMGIGLAVCWDIIEAHGGRLWCKPHPSGGAIFQFTLQVAVE